MMNNLARAVLMLYTYDNDADDISPEESALWLSTLLYDTGIRQGRNQAGTLHRRTDIRHDSAVSGVNIISTSEGVQKAFRRCSEGVQKMIFSKPRS